MATSRETGDHCYFFLIEPEENNSSNILTDADSCTYFRCFSNIFGVCYSVYVFKKSIHCRGDPGFA